MNILQRYTLKALRLNRRRTIVTIVGVALSCALLCGTAMLGTSFWDMGVRYQIANTGNWHVAFTDLPDSKTSYLTDNANVQTGMLSRSLGYAAVPKATDAYTPYIHVMAYDKAMLQNQPLTLVSGRLPRKAGEIVLSESLMKSGSASWKIGDTVTLNLGTRVVDGHPVTGTKAEMPDEANFQQGETLQSTSPQTFTVVGLIGQPDYIWSNSAGYTAITWLDTAALKPDDSVNVYVLLKQPYNTYKIAPQLAESAGLRLHADGQNADGMAYNYGLLPLLSARSSDRTADRSGSVSFLYTVLMILAILVAVILFGSVLVIRNAFALSVNGRERQFGMLTSVGATARQLRQAVHFEALFIGCVGIPLGLAAGTASTAGLLGVTGSVLETVEGRLPPMRLAGVPYALLGAALIAALTVWLSAAAPARRAAKVSPIEAIRRTGSFTISKRRLRTGRLTRALFGFEGELALKSLKRSRKKYRATVVSLCVSVVLFLSFSSLMLYVIENTRWHAADGNYIMVGLQTGENGSVSAAQKNFIDEASALPQVNASTAFRMMYAFYQTDEVGVTEEFKAAMRDAPADEQGDYNLSVAIETVGDKTFDQIARSLGQNPADYRDTARPAAILDNYVSAVETNAQGKQVKRQYNALSLRAGDAMDLLNTIVQKTDGKAAYTAQLRVGVVAPDAAAKKLSYDYSPNSGMFLLVSDTVFDSLAPHFFDGKEQAYPLQLFLHFKTPKEGAGLEAAVKKLYTQNGMGATMSYYSTVESQRKTDMMIWLARLFCYSFIVVITLIGVTNVFNTISTNMRLRRGEFAVLESVGMTPRGFHKMLWLESLFYGLKALLFAIPISMGINFIFYRLFSGSSTGSYPFLMPWGALIGSAAGVFLLVLGTMLYSASKANRESVIETIRTENI